MTMPPRHHHLAGEPENMRLRGSRKQNMIVSSRNHQYGGECANSSGGYNEHAFKVNSGSDRMINSQTGFGNDSRGSASKPGSLLNFKSGSGGNQGSSASTYNGGGGKATSSSNQNHRTTPTRANQ